MESRYLTAVKLVSDGVVFVGGDRHFHEVYLGARHVHRVDGHHPERGPHAESIRHLGADLNAAVAYSVLAAGKNVRRDGLVAVMIFVEGSQNEIAVFNEGGLFRVDIKRGVFPAEEESRVGAPDVRVELVSVKFVAPSLYVTAVVHLADDKLFESVC